MNYFEFYDIPVSFSPDKNLVRKKFYALSKEFHPDFYINEPVEKQQEILDLSTLNNRAFQTLSHQEKLLPYLLELKGVLVEGEKYNLPQSFLMEMMEVNEAIMELEFEENSADIETLSNNVNEIENDLDKKLKILSIDFEKDANQYQGELLFQIKDIWYRKKYLLRLRESIHRFATRS